MTVATTDSLKDAAAQVILAALHAAEATGAWLTGQIPDVLHQLLVWNFTKDVITVGLWLIVFFAYWRMVESFIERVKAFVPTKNSYGNPDSASDQGWFFVYMVLTIIGGIGCVIGAIIFYVYVTDAVEILIAPKVWLLEYARSLLS